jgi:hypothetical protein
MQLKRLEFYDKSPRLQTCVRGMFQLLPANLTNGARLPTGEQLKTKLATWNVLSHKAVRVLRMLAPGQGSVRAATARALNTSATGAMHGGTVESGNARTPRSAT